MAKTNWRSLLAALDEPESSTWATPAEIAEARAWIEGHALDLQDGHEAGDLCIDDNAVTSRTPDQPYAGMWVSAWVWIPTPTEEDEAA